jgi:hypothetical protein
MPTPKRHKFAIAGAAVATLAALPLAAVLYLNAGIARAAVLQMWPLKPFTQCTADPRIWCEAGAESYARALARQMPAAVRTVEQAQYAAFAAPVKVYVYDTIGTYARYGGGREAGGRSAFGAVHMSPVLRDRPWMHEAMLAHELSHLHLGQQTGVMAMWRLPAWFREGYPTLVSGGGGAFGATPENAIFALVHGRHFEAEDSTPLLAPHMWTYFKLPAPMFYRQSALMVDYMRRRDPAAFARMVAGIAARKRFAGAVREAYGQPLAVLWQDFRGGLRSHPAARWDDAPVAAAAPLNIMH